MRVLLIDPSLYAPQYNDPLATALSEHHDISVVGRPERSDQVPSVFPVDGHFYRLSERLRARHRLAGQAVKPVEHALDLVRLVRRARQVDVVHFQWAVVPLLDRLAMAAIGRHRPVVFTVHDTTTMHGSANWVQRSGMRSVLEAADALIVHTDHSRAVLVAAGVDPARIAVVPHGQVGHSGATVAAPNQRLRILEYGKIRPYKGIDVLIDAVAEARRQVGDAFAVTIAGEPLVEVGDLQARARERGVDHLFTWELGYISAERTDELLGAHDVMALPYTDIDSSGVLALAQTWPMPVVASRVGGFAEQLADAAGARLFPSRDHHALAALLVELTDHQRLEERRAGAAADLQRLPGWPEAARLTTELYERLVAARRSG